MSVGKKALIQLRNMIVLGEIKGGTRLAEIPTAKLLGISRQPVRIAFRLLEQEGLLTKNVGRGYTVTQISQKMIVDALAVRGVLEGLASRELAEKGLSKTQHTTLKDCLEQIDSLLVKERLNKTDIGLYHHYNLIFHDTIIQGANNQAIHQAIAINNHLPMASIQAMTFDESHYDLEIQRLRHAHVQHRLIYESLCHQEPVKAELLMREHSQVAILTSLNQHIVNDPTNEKVT